MEAQWGGEERGRDGTRRRACRDAEPDGEGEEGEEEDEEGVESQRDAEERGEQGDVQLERAGSEERVAACGREAYQGLHDLPRRLRVEVIEVVFGVGGMVDVRVRVLLLDGRGGGLGLAVVVCGRVARAPSWWR